MTIDMTLPEMSPQTKARLTGAFYLLTILLGGAESISGRFMVYPYVVAIGLLGAAAVIIWLLVFGVHEQEWKEQARKSAASIWA